VKSPAFSRLIRASHAELFRNAVDKEFTKLYFFLQKKQKKLSLETAMHAMETLAKSKGVDLKEVLANKQK
jgi:hypothetical protein